MGGTMSIEKLNHAKNAAGLGVWHTPAVPGSRPGRPPKAAPTGTNQLALSTWRVIDERRTRMGISMTNVARAGGVAKSTISRWANGEAIPEFEAVYKIWLLLRLGNESLDVLVEQHEDRSAPKNLRQLVAEEAQVLDLFQRNKDFRDTVRRMLRIFGGKAG